MRRVYVEESDPERVADFCERLEEGDILFFSRSPVQLSEEDASFLRGRRQTETFGHKNIVYRPRQDRLTGAPPGKDLGRLREVMRGFSQQSEKVLSLLLPHYAQGWKIDFASIRPFEESGRTLSIHARNDLLHFDAFPTRPTNGDRILRFFFNLNLERPRVWLTSDDFESLARQLGEKAGLPMILRRAASPLRQRLAKAARKLHLPPFSRSPYDAAMRHFHNYLKENGSFQKECRKKRWEFPPQSGWLVFTDVVSHAVLTGQMALEQTFIVPHQLMLHPELAPASILERLAGQSVTR